ncbi:uncharacterized protein LOC142143933 [Mixophyes fleayi]|uniref:uncharacterized protein LOC142143933 n=1 Tax=Mixophyes fleayi TaxID=3061075 RepID=UPI003F4E3495
MIRVRGEDADLLPLRRRTQRRFPRGRRSSRGQPPASATLHRLTDVKRVLPALCVRYSRMREPARPFSCRWAQGSYRARWERRQCRRAVVEAQAAEEEEEQQPVAVAVPQSSEEEEKPVAVAVALSSEEEVAQPVPVAVAVEEQEEEAADPEPQQFQDSTSGSQEAVEFEDTPTEEAANWPPPPPTTAELMGHMAEIVEDLEGVHNRIGQIIANLRFKLAYWASYMS